MADKRALQRVRKRLPLRFGNAEPVRLAFTEDISRRGLFIKTVNLYPPGTKIVVDVQLPGEKLVRISGSIRWTKKVPANMIHKVNKCGMGVKIHEFLSGEEAFMDYMQGYQP